MKFNFLSCLFLLLSSFTAVIGLSQEPEKKDPAPAAQSAPAEKEPSETPADSSKSGADEKKPDEKKPDEKKPDEKKPDEKKPDEKKPDEKKPDEKKPDEKKPDGGKSPETNGAKPVDDGKLPVFGYTDTPFLPGQPWRVHDLFRPHPKIVTVKDEGGPASDSVMLFDGTHLGNWCHQGEKPGELLAPQWRVQDGYFEIVPGTGSLQTIDTFGSCQVHLEWAAPKEIQGASQQRGDSGVLLMGAFEVQILDSFNNRTYADGQAASLYGVYPPLVNAAREPGQWQVFDIIFEAPRYEGDLLISKAYLTILHNGLIVHHRRELPGFTVEKDVPKYELLQPAAPLVLQDHGSPVRFRNIWIRPLHM